MDSDIAAFSEGLALLDLKETELAIALMWFLEQRGDVRENTAAQLSELMHELSLRGQINISRLAKNLATHPDVVRGKQPSTFKIKLARKRSLTERYQILLKRPQPKIEDHVISRDDFMHTRRYLEALVFQINGTYQYGFYDGCIVLCRRLVETLLIEAFEKNSKSSAIKHNNNYLQLSDIIAIAKGGQHIKLARGTAKALEEIKEAGDAGAHSRTYITKQKDVDDLKLTLRRVVSELMHLAKIERTQPS